MMPNEKLLSERDAPLSSLEYKYLHLTNAAIQNDLVVRAVTRKNILWMMGLLFLDEFTGKSRFYVGRKKLAAFRQKLHKPQILKMM